MDILKKELEKKRKLMQEMSGGKKFVKTSDIEKRKLAEIREQERRELEKKASQQKNSSSKAPLKKENEVSASEKRYSDAVIAAEEAIDKLVLPKAEVIRRLRFLKHPVTLFGEDDEERLTRLKFLMKSGDFELEGESTEGQQNDFLRDLRNLKQEKRSKEGETKKGDKGDGLQDSKDGEGSGKRKEDIDSKRFNTKFVDLCEEDKILVYFKTILQEWEVELDEKTDAEKRTQQFKSTMATYRQCARYIDPLFRMCRRKVRLPFTFLSNPFHQSMTFYLKFDSQHLDDDIKEALSFIVKMCRERDYLAAMDKYIKLAIGNAPWPIGVTMVGIHERSAREKIHTNSVAHIMNDETTRKYLQSVKRLMTLAQRKYPALPSKSVEFNSLANGSDLESLKKEEALKTGDPEQLKLTAIAHNRNNSDDDGDDDDSD